MGVPNVGIQYLFVLLSQRILSLLIFGQIIFQAVPKDCFCTFYVSIQILYMYPYSSVCLMTFDLYI